MIQGATIRCESGTDDAVLWAYANADELPLDITAITRVLFICKLDGQQDISVDSALLPVAFVFNTQTIVNGRSVHVLKWYPGKIRSAFAVLDVYACDVYLFDAGHTGGVKVGQFNLDVR